MRSRMIAFIGDSPTTICPRIRATRVPEQSKFGTSENVFIANLSELVFWSQTDCGDDCSPTYRRVCRNVDVSAASNAEFFFDLKDCPFLRKLSTDTCEGTDD